STPNPPPLRRIIPIQGNPPPFTYWIGVFYFLVAGKWKCLARKRWARAEIGKMETRLETRVENGSGGGLREERKVRGNC
ncbi:MAG: hypothetical protein WHU94_06685, partial [Thermogemmata sp.]